MYVKVNSNELYHHGILGQKWGTRNGPPYPLGYSKHSPAEKKAMTKEEKYRAKAVDRVSARYGNVARQYEKTAEKYNDKLLKLNKKYSNIEEAYSPGEKGSDLEKTTKKLSKIEDKAYKLHDKLEAVNVGKELCNNLLEKEIGHIKTMDISADKKEQGKRIAKDALKSGVVSGVATAGLTLAGIPAIALVSFNTKESRLNDSDVLSSMKYAGAGEDKGRDKVISDVIRRTTNYDGSSIVKKAKAAPSEDRKLGTGDFDKNGNRIPESWKNQKGTSTKPSASKEDSIKTVREWYTKSQQESKLKTAKEKDQYDLYFLEAIQNTKILDDGNKAAVDRQYKIYLEDPDDYFKNKADKLATV